VHHHTLGRKWGIIVGGTRKLNMHECLHSPRLARFSIFLTLKIEKRVRWVRGISKSILILPPYKVVYVDRSIAYFLFTFCCSAGRGFETSLCQQIGSVAENIYLQNVDHGGVETASERDRRKL
jgi:hypothetical protein